MNGEGEMREEKLYKVKEISLATGIKTGTLYSRIDSRHIPRNKDGYTYEQVKIIVKRPRTKRKADRKNVETLQLSQKNDGYL